jgi:hypothetical protein
MILSADGRFEYLATRQGHQLDGYALASTAQHDTSRSGGSAGAAAFKPGPAWKKLRPDDAVWHEVGPLPCRYNQVATDNSSGPKALVPFTETAMMTAARYISPALLTTLALLLGNVAHVHAGHGHHGHHGHHHHGGGWRASFSFGGPAYYGAYPTAYYYPAPAYYYPPVYAAPAVVTPAPAAVPAPVVAAPVVATPVVVAPPPVAAPSFSFSIGGR